MSAGAVNDTRSRLMETAAKLFIVYSVRGTTLQMIADELGITEAAVHAHFESKDAVAEAIVELVFTEASSIVDAASRQHTLAAQMDDALDGFIDLIVRHRILVRLISRDPGLTRAASRTARQPAISDSRTKLIALLVGAEPTSTDRMTGHLLFRELAMAVANPEHADIDDETLRRDLRDMGMRLLGRESAAPGPSPRDMGMVNPPQQAADRRGGHGPE